MTEKHTIAELAEAFADNGSSFRAAARALGYADHKSLERRLKRAAARGELGFAAVLPGFEIKQVTNTPKGDYIKQVQEHGQPFELPTGHTIRGISAYTDSDGNVRATWIKTGKANVVGDLVAALRAEFAEYAGRSELIDPPAVTDAELLNIYPIADQHNGLLAWGVETGEPYDLKIGAERLRRCMAELVSGSPASRQAIILNLGDWQHTDDSSNATPTNRNTLDVDSRYFKIVRAGVKLMMDCIELALARHERVLVRNIPGNHDPHSSVALTVALAAFYENNPRVTVDLDPSDWFFYRFGRSLIGATHGHKCKPEQMAMVLANARPDDWAAAPFRSFYFGHVHHQTAKEVGGVVVESFQSLAAKDAWSHGRGYLAGNSLTSITHHIEDGEISRRRVNIVPPRYKALENIRAAA